jgi:serine/threonine-protein kinase RsbW
MAIVVSESLIRVAVPASPDVLHLLRSVTASVGARMSMSLDDVEELRIAVDEAAALLLDRADDAGGRTLELALTCTDRSLTASVSLDGAAGSDEDAARASWPWRVITAVTDDASFQRADGRLTITFTKSAPGSDR